MSRSCRAAQWMAASEGSAEAARCGMWYYRYSCALLYCGRLEEALAYAEKGSGGGAGLCVGLATTGQAAQPLW